MQRRLWLHDEIAPGLRVFGQVCGQELQSYKAVEPGVLCLVNHSHSSAAEPFDDAVVRDGLADQLSRILQPRKGW